MNTILKVDDINVYYGAIHAIKGVSFEVNEGEVVTLIGANGAGKSTILKTVAGLLSSRTGSVQFMGKDLGGIPAHKIVPMGLALVPEGRQIFQQMTVEENLQMGAFTRPADEYDASIADVYQRFPRLKERQNQIAGTLSGGEQQMLAMGRALMSCTSCWSVRLRWLTGYSAGSSRRRRSYPLQRMRNNNMSAI